MSGRGENLLFDTFTGSLKKSIPRMTHEWIGCLKQLSSMFYRFERLLHKIILQIGLNMNWKTEKTHWLIKKKKTVFKQWQWKAMTDSAFHFDFKFKEYNNSF